MASVQPLRTGSEGQNGGPAGPAAFQAGEGEDARLAGRIAFALAAETGEEATPEAVLRLRQQADRLLAEHAFRYLHNTIEQIRRDAIAEHLGRLPRPPGFGRIVLANLVALAIAGAAAGWLALHPETLAGLAGAVTG
ncbi:MAG TPA: hypothetical protein VE684_10580 [Crenalkalicoccus sp.]|jgi:hypothetical protein|nr:hypothetical protein [Crenalkalicoccus sp.]